MAFFIWFMKDQSAKPSQSKFYPKNGLLVCFQYGFQCTERYTTVYVYISAINVDTSEMLFVVCYVSEHVCVCVLLHVWVCLCTLWLSMGLRKLVKIEYRNFWATSLCVVFVSKRFFFAVLLITSMVVDAVLPGSLLSLYRFFHCDIWKCGFLLGKLVKLYGLRNMVSL